MIEAENCPITTEPEINGSQPLTFGNNTAMLLFSATGIAKKHGNAPCAIEVLIGKVPEDSSFKKGLTDCNQCTRQVRLSI